MKPRYALVRQTRNTAGERACTQRLTAGVETKKMAISVGNRNISAENSTPSTQSTAMATRNVRLAWRGRFRVFASEIMRLRATGSPAVEMVSSTL